MVCLESWGRKLDVRGTGRVLEHEILEDSEKR
jgi:hypothetical protein